MKIGIPKEIKNRENRVAITPEGVHALVDQGHEVFIETKAGLGSGITDQDYIESGAKIVENASQAWSNEMIMKVKEPLEEEFKYFKEGQILFTFLHLANEPLLTKALQEYKVNSIAYETITEGRDLPLLMPMSQVAGRMATIIGSQYLQSQKGGSGILLGSVPGVKRGRVTIIGGGNVGVNAAIMAIGLGADVTLIDRNPSKLKDLDLRFGKDMQTLVSNSKNIHDAVIESDLVIGAVLLEGGSKAPKLVKEDTVKQMKPGSVIVDVAIDQGGIFETIDKVTTHDNPVYEKHGVIHYAVANIPGSVPRTSTYALTNSTLKYALEIARNDITSLIKNNASIKNGVNTYLGHITNESVAKEHRLNYTNIDDLI